MKCDQCNVRFNRKKVHRITVIDEVKQETKHFELCSNDCVDEAIKQYYLIKVGEVRHKATPIYVRATKQQRREWNKKMKN